MAEGQQSSAKDAVSRVLEDSQAGLPDPKRHATATPPGGSAPSGSGASNSKSLEELLRVLVQNSQDQAQQLIRMQEQQAVHSAALVAALSGLSAAPSGVAATPVVPQQPQQSQEVEFVIPPELDKEILKCTRQFKDDVLKLVRAKKRLAKLHGDANVFSGDDSSYPKSHSAFKSQVSFAELDNAVNDAAMSPVSITIEIPQGTTRREAMRKVHRQCAVFQNAMQLEAQLDHVAACEPSAEAKILEGLVLKVLEEASKPSHAESLGLPRPLSATVDKSVVDARVQHLYAKVFETVNKKLSIDAAATEQSHSSAMDAESALINQKPADLLTELVAAQVDAKMASAGLDVSDVPDEARMANQGDYAESFIRALHIDSKNGGSPPGGVGQNTRPYVAPTPKLRARRPYQSHTEGKGKDSGKGKGNAESKGKSKGKGKDSAKGKGKSLGKGKGKSIGKGKGKGKGKSSALPNSAKGVAYNGRS